MPTITHRVRFNNLGKTYPGVRALDGVTFSVARGCVHALIGENGAGKSTLIKILAGATPADNGGIVLDGEAVAIRDARHARQLGVAVVHQEFNLAPDMTVAENIFMGQWPRRRGAIDFAALNEQARGLLQSLGIELPVDRAVAGLSVAQQQMIEIAKALSQDAGVLVLDEPSAVLTAHELKTLFRLIRDARARGVSVIYVSHRLEEIFEIADAVTVLRDGRHVSTRPIHEASRDVLVTEMVGRPLSEEFPRRDATIGEVALRVEGLSAKGRFHDLGFEVRRGEVFGLTGLVGAGRSSVLRAIFGDVRADAGQVRVGATAGPFRSPRRALAAGVMMLPEDRKLDGLLLERPLRENVTLACHKGVARGGFFNRRAESELVARMMADLRIRAVSGEVPTATLSGGNQQKVLMARCLALPLAVLLLDEPTRGIDVGGKYEIYTLINRLAVTGMATVMVSSELPETIGMCDRIGVMHEGRLMGILDNGRRQVTQEDILRLAWKLDRSEAAA